VKTRVSLFIYTKLSTFPSSEKTNIFKEFAVIWPNFRFKFLFFFLCPGPPGGKLQTSENSAHVEPVVSQVEWADDFGFIKTDLREAR